MEDDVLEARALLDAADDIERQREKQTGGFESFISAISSSILFIRPPKDHALAHLPVSILRLYPEAQTSPL